MCENLFRAYDKGRKEYLSNGNLFIAINTSNYPNKSEIYLDEIGNADKYKERFIIEQYTGFKDKNIKKIFEGDIVKANGGIYEVKLNKGCWIIFNSLSWDFLSNNAKGCEKIGNIHDNPELLTG